MYIPNKNTGIVLIIAHNKKSTEMGQDAHFIPVSVITNIQAILITCITPL